MYGGQTYIAAAGAVATILLQVIEERAEERRIQVPQGQIRRRLASMFVDVLQQYSKGIAVTRNSVRADVPLSHESIEEKRLQESR
jgi:hypothetical protein